MNESTATYRAVRIDDVADWHLICVIAADGMCAYLKHTDPTHEIITLFEQKWEPDEEGLLEMIEKTVYDHPQVLEDFSADICVVAPNSLWVPTDLLDDDEDTAYDMYKTVYGLDAKDVLEDEIGEATCLYALTSGLRGFLQRTFPGSNIRSHLGVMVKRFSERSADMPRVYLDIRDKEVDIIAFESDRMISAATQCWNAPDDIQYHLFNLLNVYHLDPQNVQVSLSGLKDIKNELLVSLRNRISYVMLTMVPTVSAKAGMPLPAALLTRL